MIEPKALRNIAGLFCVNYAEKVVNCVEALYGNFFACYNNMDKCTQAEGGFLHETKLDNDSTFIGHAAV